MSRKNRSRRLELQHAVIPLVIAFSTFAAFLPTLQNQFVSWDDDKNFLENPHYRGLGWTQLRWMWTTHLGHYIPLTWMTLGLRSEEHTSELQSQSNLVCRLLLEKKKEDRHHSIADR